MGKITPGGELPRQVCACAAQISHFAFNSKALSTGLLTTRVFLRDLGLGTEMLGSFGFRLWVLLHGSQEARSRDLLMEWTV